MGESQSKLAEEPSRTLIIDEWEIPDAYKSVGVSDEVVKSVSASGPTFSVPPNFAETISQHQNLEVPEKKPLPSNISNPVSHQKEPIKQMEPSKQKNLDVSKKEPEKSKEPELLPSNVSEIFSKQKEPEKPLSSSLSEVVSHHQNLGVPQKKEVSKQKEPEKSEPLPSILSKDVSQRQDLDVMKKSKPVSSLLSEDVPQRQNIDIPEKKEPKLSSLSEDVWNHQSLDVSQDKKMKKLKFLPLSLSEIVSQQKDIGVSKKKEMSKLEPLSEQLSPIPPETVSKDKALEVQENKENEEAKEHELYLSKVSESVDRITKRYSGYELVNNCAEAEEIFMRCLRNNTSTVLNCAPFQGC